jgi:SAM-dependent methyltransferase
MLKALPSDGVVAEIGVYSGDWSADILRLAAPRKLHLIDWWPEDLVITNAREEASGGELYRQVLSRFDVEIQSGRLLCHRGKSASVADEFEDYYFDWIYLDADHSFAGVRSDLRKYFWKVKPGGYIVGHDYVAVSKTGKKYGVIEAVQEFMQEYPVIPVGLTADYHASFILKVDSPASSRLGVRHPADAGEEDGTGRSPSDAASVGIVERGNEAETATLDKLRATHVVVKHDPPRRVDHLLERLREEQIDIQQESINANAYQAWMNRVDYENSYPEYVKSFPKGGSLTKKSLEHFLSIQYIEPRADDVIIDVGSHRSPFTEILKALYSVRCAYRQDISYPPGVHTYMIGSDAARIPLPDGSVDKAVSHCAVEHFEDDSDILFIEEAARLLKPNGLLFIIPVWIAEVYFIQTSEGAWAKHGIPRFDPLAVISIQDQYENRFARYLNPVRLKQRLLQIAKMAGLKYEFIHFTNWQEFPRCPTFALRFSKIRS